MKHLFRAICAVVLSAASILTVNSQEIKWQEYSDKRFVYEISNKQAVELIRKTPDSTEFRRMIGEPILSYDKIWNNVPSQGHFIIASIVRNNINYSYYPVYPFRIYLFKEYGALTLQITDKAGKIRDDAKVNIRGTWFMQNRKVSFDSKSKTYSLTEWSKQRKWLLTVELDGFMAIFDLDKHIVERWFGGGGSYNEYKPEFYSYMITDKNKYKPGESVRFKSYALDGNRKPIGRKLQLWLGDDNYNFKKITDVEPYNPGGFAGELQLHDSLKLKLDKYYPMQLRESSGRIIANAQFYYEDYELYDNTLQVKLTSGVQYYPDANSIEIKATDSNGLNLQDAKATITILARSVQKPIVDRISVPDTILTRKIDLDNEKSTTFEIPASLFGDVDCGYLINVEVLTFDNQRMDRNMYAQFFRSRHEITYVTSNDSLCFEFKELGKMRKIEAELSYTGLEQPIKVELPYKMPFNQSVKNYMVKVADPETLLNLKANEIYTGMYVKGDIKGDSLSIEVVNPLKLEFSWYIYKGDMLLKRGEGRELKFQHENIDLDVVHYIDIFYRIGDTEQSVSRQFSPMKDHLNLEVDLPDRVYPGQKIDAVIQVKDVKGRPVKNVDLTAMAYNSTLNHYVPDLSYYGQEAIPRDYDQASYSKKYRGYGKSEMLNYKEWRDKSRLDTMSYYRFTYPWDVMFKHTVNTIDSITQFAPYVMRHGEALNAFVIEDNGVPVYFSWTDNLKGYSFPVSDKTKHKISIRLHDRVLIFDSISFEPGKKTILSVDLDHLPLNVRSFPMTEKDNYNRFVLRNDEVAHYSQYIANMPIASNQKFTYLIKKDSTILPLYHYLFSGYKATNLIGPVSPERYRYNSGVEYKHTGGVSYAFDENVVYKTAMRVCPEFLGLSQSNNFSNLNQFYFSSKYLDSTVRKIELDAHKWFPAYLQLVQKQMKLHFGLPVEKDSTGVSSLLLIDNSTNNVYSRNKLNYGQSQYREIPQGTYDILLIYNNGKYLKYKDYKVVKNAYNYLNLSQAELCQRDSLSMKWLSLNPIPPKPVYNRYNLKTNQSIITISRIINRSGNVVQGYITSASDGEPLPGARVFAPEISIGAITDMQGFFEIDMSGATILKIDYLGFKSQEVQVQPNTEIRIALEERANSLDEVVVVGFGSAKKESVVGSISGIVVRGSNAPISNDRLALTMANVKEDAMDMKVQKPGSVILSEDTVDSAEADLEITAMAPPVSESDAAEARLYQELLMLSGLRSNFSDVGFWEPRLFTDKDGKAKLSVTFPDNITMWQAVVYAMNRKLQTGTYRKEIKSYKPLMAELKTPQFLVAGDESYFAGNIRNYTGSNNITGTIKFAQEADTLMNREITFENSHQDKMLVVAGQTDSVHTTYLFRRDDGYTDGEKRVINVVPQGTEIAQGVLKFLSNGDKVDVAAAIGEEVQVKIASKQLDVYMDAASYLRGYRYACNEQLASKLIGLLNFRLYEQFKGEKFKHDKDVNAIIKRLLDNQNSGKLWSWWGNSSETSFWMSAHVLKALKMAQESGYAVNLNVENIEQDYVDTKSYRNPTMYDIDILHALSEWGTQQDYAPAIERFEKEIRKLEIREDSIAKANKRKPNISFLKEKLMLWEIRQRQELDFKSDSIAKYLKKDVLGAVYCDDGIPRYWYADNLLTTLIAYRIVKNDPALSQHKDAMQMYVLGTKHYGWNTYQAASAVSTIMPDLLAESASKDKPATIVLKGKENKELSKFPYETTLTSGEKLNVEKKEGMPLIFTSFTMKRVTKAHSGEAFEVSTKIEAGDTLVAGKPVALTVTVEVKQKNAEHVMIEIPIPAGCSYESKPNYFYRFNEVHREYFKEKTVIFCERLPEGTHEFTINLLPRYTGSYILNPAKVEMMYFPTVNANNDMRKIDVADRE